MYELVYMYVLVKCKLLWFFIPIIEIIFLIIAIIRHLPAILKMTNCIAFSFTKEIYYSSSLKVHAICNEWKKYMSPKLSLIWKYTCTSMFIISVTQSCPTLCDPTDCSMPGFPVYHQLLEFTQTHVHRVSDAI